MKEEILKLVKKYNGIITTSQVEDSGISRVYLKSLVDEGLLVRQKQGVYAIPEVANDELYIFQVKHPNAIFSYETALYLHGINKIPPGIMDVTVYTGYNTHRFPDNVQSHYVKKELVNLDVVTVKTKFGNNVKCYSPARTICDIVKTTKDNNQEYVNTALNNYFKSNVFNQNKLIETANKMNCYKKLNYTVGVGFLANKFASRELL